MEQPKHFPSETCTYNRKLRNLFHNISISSTKPKKYLKSDTLIKPGTLGILLCIISFGIVQYSCWQTLKRCFSDEKHEIVVNSGTPTVIVSTSIVKSSCDCDNLTEGEISTSFSSSSSSSAQVQNSGIKENYLIKKQLQISESIWKRSVSQRHAWISTIAKNNLTQVNPWDGDNYVFFWNYFSPSFNCPHSVQRVGFIGDGGKWMCGLELYETQKTGDAKPPCIIYSFGVANESSFEAEILNRTNCLVFAYDYSVKSIGSPVEPTNSRVTFKALGIGNKNLGKFRTLKNLMEQNGHEWIDILKMDIEGGEYAALDKVMQDFPDHCYDNSDNNHRTKLSSSSFSYEQTEKQPLPFGQLLLEVHVDGKIFPKFYEWWERLEARGLRAFYSEVNHVACAVTMVKPNFVEYSFINIRGKHRLLQ